MAENVTQYCHVCKTQTTSGPPVGLSNGIRENVSGAFIFARRLCDIGCLESSRSTLESTCRDGEQRTVF